MNAHQITKALAGSWRGSYGIASCPCHDDGHTPALKITDDARKYDGIDLHCFAGCEWRTVKAMLRERGLLHESSRSTSPSRCRRSPFKASPKPTSPIAVDIDHDFAADTRRRIAKAPGIWQRSTPAIGSLVEVYLTSRAITLPPPPSLRFHADLTHGPSGLLFPAMVAAVQGPDRAITGIHRTYLLPGGAGKAQVSSPKMALGPVGYSAVRLAKAGPVLGLAEGIETALSAMQLFDTNCWAALGSRLHKVSLPEIVRHVVLFADNGAAGVEAAHKATEEFTSQGRKVTRRLPPEGFGDWNDALVALAAEQRE